MKLFRTINELNPQKNVIADISKRPLEYAAERLLNIVLRSTKSTQHPYNKSLIEKIGQILSTIIWIGNRDLLSEQESAELTKKIEELTEDFQWDQIEHDLTALLQKISDNCPKCRIVALLTDFEHLACVHATGLDPAKLQEITAPIFDNLPNLSLIELKTMEKDILEIRAHYLQTPEDFSFIFERLKNL